MTFYLCYATAPPEITVEKSWVHASEGYDIELACIVHGDVTSDVSIFSLFHILDRHTSTVSVQQSSYIVNEYIYIYIYMYVVWYTAIPLAESGGLECMQYIIFTARSIRRPVFEM